MALTTARGSNKVATCNRQTLYCCVCVGSCMQAGCLLCAHGCLLRSAAELPADVTAGAAAVITSCTWRTTVLQKAYCPATWAQISHTVICWQASHHNSSCLKSNCKPAVSLPARALIKGLLSANDECSLLALKVDGRLLRRFLFSSSHTTGECFQCNHCCAVMIRPTTLATCNHTSRQLT